MAVIEIRTTPYEIKADGADERLIKGYGSTFEEPENYDSYGDVFAKGAWEEDLKERGPDGAGKWKTLWQHSWTEPIGKPIEAREDDRGLYMVRKVSEVAEGDKALKLIADEVIDSLSVGFESQRYEILEDITTSWGWAVRQITKAKLFEDSPVTFPANENALIETDKSKRGDRSNVLALAFRARVATKGADPNTLIQDIAQATGMARRDVQQLMLGYQQVEARTASAISEVLELPIQALAEKSSFGSPLATVLASIEGLDGTTEGALKLSINTEDLRRVRDARDGLTKFIEAMSELGEEPDADKASPEDDSDVGLDAIAERFAGLNDRVVALASKIEGEC